MKIRNGFVSNSSSSSFIIGLGLISDYNKFESWFKKTLSKGRTIYHCFDYGVIDYNSIFSNEEYVKKQLDYYSIEKIENDSETKITFESFTFNRVSLKINEENKNNIFFYSYKGCEGDHKFCKGDNWPDYDIDIDFFKKEQQEVIIGFNKNNGFSEWDIKFGAGRDG